VLDVQRHRLDLRSAVRHLYNGTGWTYDQPSGISTTAGGTVCKRCGGSGQIVVSRTVETTDEPLNYNERGIPR
jgi:hypothetical protein